MEGGTEEAKETSQAAGPKTITKTVILPDGSYGTETIVVDDTSKAQVNISMLNLYRIREQRQLLMTTHPCVEPS